MGAVSGRKPGARGVGPRTLALRLAESLSLPLALPLILLLFLTGCVPPAPQPGSTGQPTGSAPASSAVSPSASPGVPGDTDETGPPQTGDKVISAKVALDWAWPGPGRAFKAAHQNPVPLAPPPADPLPVLYAIGAGQHPAQNPPFDQLSFRFQGGFPSYELEFVPQLLADGSGLPVPLPGAGAVLKVVLRGAQAHTADGAASSIKTAPPQAVGFKALAGYAQAGDFEGVLSYGIGVGRTVPDVPETKVRVYEVEKIDRGKHLYVVAVQLESTQWK